MLATNDNSTFCRLAYKLGYNTITRFESAQNRMINFASTKVRTNTQSIKIAGYSAFYCMDQSENFTDCGAQHE